jgi:hypothetical protein
LFGRYNGLGDLVHTSADNIVVQSFTYKFPAGSATGDNNAIIDGTLITVGDELKLDVPGVRLSLVFRRLLMEVLQSQKTNL